MKIILLLSVALFIKMEVRAGENDLYDFLWLDPEKKVFVLQNKIHEKKNKFNINLGYVSNLTSKFQDTNAYSLGAEYFFSEEWGIEAFYLGYQNTKNDDYKSLQLINEVDPFIRRMNSIKGLGIVWSPFYGKINTFNKIFYFDWSFSAGISQIEMESNLNTVTQASVQSKFEKEKVTGAHVKTGLKIHLDKNWSVGVEYMNNYFNSPKPSNPKKDKLNINSDVIFNVGFSF